MHGRVLVPGLGGDLPGDVPSAARRLEAARPVLPHDAADDCEGEAHQHPGAQQQQHGGGRQGLRGAAPPVDGVDHAPRQEERSWEGGESRGACKKKRLNNKILYEISNTVLNVLTGQEYFKGGKLGDSLNS